MTNSRELLIHWKKPQLEVMNSALKRYQILLHPKSNSPPIAAQLKIVHDLRIRINKAIKNCEDDGDTQSPQFSIDDYRFMCDLLHKYYGARKQEYKERVQRVTIKGELYYEEIEMELINTILQAEVFNRIDHENNRIRILTDSLYIEPEDMKKKERQISSITNIHQKIENNYGQAIANNQGIINQTNHPEITSILKELITKVLETDISQNEKSEIVSDLEVMKTESAKVNPDKKIFGIKFPTLEKLANFSQISSFVLQILPIIKSFVKNLPQF